MKLPDLPHGVAVLTPRRTLPRRGLVDPGWQYVKAADTNVAKTIADEWARLAAQHARVVDPLEERAAVRAVIAEMCDGAGVDRPKPPPELIWDLPLSALPPPVATWLAYHGGGIRSRSAQAGRLDPDTAVSLAAVALLGAACRFAGLFS